MVLSFKNRILKSVFSRFMFLAFSIYLTIALAATAGRIWIDYNDTKNFVIESLTITQKAYERGLARAIWFMDKGYIDAQVNGIKENPHIIGINIKGDKNQNYIFNKSLQKTVNNRIEHHFSLVHTSEDGEAYRVGDVTFYTSKDTIIQHLLPKVLLSLLYFLILIIALGIIVYFIGHRIIRRPLNKLISTAREIDFDNLEHVRINIQEPGQNEFNVLEDTLDSMVKNLLESRTKLNMNRQQLQDIINNATAVIFVKDLQGRYMLTNKRFDTLFANGGHGVTEKTDRDLFQQEMADTFRKNDVKVIETKEPLEVEELVPHRDGNHTYLSVKFPLFDPGDKLYGICCIATDITERKKTENLLKNYSQQLKSEVELQTLELKKAKELAETANIAKSDFLASMSHELRTPLNAVLGFAQVLSKDKNLPAHHGDYVAMIRQSGDILLALINQILDLSKIESGKMSVVEASFNLHDILDELNKMFYLLSEQKRLTLSIECAKEIPRNIVTDELKLRQILINLINNALQFTKKGSVSLMVKSQEKSIDNQSSSLARPVFLQFEIKDTGPGIDPGEIDMLFNPFTQAEEGKKAHKGTGLGLSISKKFVELMGGEITVKSRLNKGTTFSFFIPVKEANLAEEDQTRTKKIISNPAPINSLDIIKTDLESLSRPLIRKLEESATYCEVDDIHQIIQQIESPYPDLAKELEHLVKEFDFDGILTLIKETR